MKIYGLSDVGELRTVNEDTFTYYQKGDKTLCVICDGMGGAKAGDTASETALDAIVDVLAPEGEIIFDESNMEQMLREAFSLANENIHKLSEKNPEYRGMGTTAVCLVSAGKQGYIGNVGDSRAYKVTDTKVKLITRDHSLVFEMLRRGDLTPGEAQRHPSRNVITRALGVDEEVDCDIFTVNCSKGEKILLCSDGLTSELADKEIFSVLNNKDIETACANLIERAKAAGGRDNITVILAAL